MYSESELLKWLRQLSDDLGRAPTRREMRDSNGPSSDTYANRFGSWNAALEAANLSLNEYRGCNREELIEWLWKHENDLGRAPTKPEINSLDGPSDTLYMDRFGSWSNALDEAGLEPKSEEVLTDEELIAELHRLTEEMEKTPTAQEMEEVGNYSPGTYHKRFGSWNEGIEAAGLEPRVRYGSGEDHHSWKGGYDDYYGPNWDDQRGECLERDGYKCQMCEDDKDSIGFEPDVHHISPLREFRHNGELDYESANELDNLITLCRSCHVSIEGSFKNLSATEFSVLVNIEV